MGNGAWSLQLDEATPGQVLRRLRVAESGRGHIVVTPTWVDLGGMADAAALALARYTGIYLRREHATNTLSGYGVNAWLGEDDNVGRSTGGTTQTLTFEDWAAFVTPSYLGTGIRSSIPGNFKHTYDAITFRGLADSIAARYNCAWHVTPDFKLNFGTFSALFRNPPKALVVRHRDDSGRDLNIRGLHGDLDMVEDIEDWRRRIVYFYDGGSEIQTGGVADADTPFRGPDGSPAFVDEIVVDQQTDNSTDAQSLSLARWRQVTGVRQELTLSSVEYDIGKDVAVGDNLYVYDPDRGIYDLTRELAYRGQRIHPAVIRCVGYTWPVREGMGVWFRRYRKVDSSWVVEWIDLTPYVLWESGDTTVEVGAKPRTTLA